MSGLGLRDAPALRRSVSIPDRRSLAEVFLLGVGGVLTMALVLPGAGGLVVPAWIGMGILAGLVAGSLPGIVVLWLGIATWTNGLAVVAWNPGRLAVSVALYGAAQLLVATPAFALGVGARRWRGWRGPAGRPARAEPPAGGSPPWSGRVVGVACAAVLWAVPALFLGGILSLPIWTSDWAAVRFGWWLGIGLLAAMIGGIRAAPGLWVGAVATPLAVVAFGGIESLLAGSDLSLAAPFWLGWMGEAFAIMTLAYLAGIAALAGIRRIREGGRARPRPAGSRVPILRRAVVYLPGMLCLVPALLPVGSRGVIATLVACALVGAAAGLTGAVDLAALWLGAAVLPLVGTVANALGLGVDAPSSLPIGYVLPLIGMALLAATPGHLLGTMARRRRGPAAEPRQG